MSAHRTLNDLYRAFSPDIGPGLLGDPGDAGTIIVGMWGQICPVVTAGSETRTLAQPNRAGVSCVIALDTDGGDLTLTVTGGYNGDDDTEIVFDDAGDFVSFVSVKVGTSYLWRVVGQEGTDAAAEDLSIDQFTATTGEIGTLTVDTIATDAEAAEHGAGAIGTAAVPVTYRYIKNGSIITEIKVDLTGLDSSGTENDVIGLSTGGAAYLGRYVVATCGIVYRIEMSCLEIPLTGDADVILVAGSAADEAFDDTVANIAALCDGTGDWGLGETIVNNAPAALAANYYLYLTQGATDNATYTAGQFVIRLYGHPLLT